MEDKAFKDLVKEMRFAQKSYFSTDKIHEPDQKRYWLKESKRLEKLVDEEFSDQQKLEL